jgi:hypothetical protein
LIYICIYEGKEKETSRAQTGNDDKMRKKRKKLKLSDKEETPIDLEKLEFTNEIMRFMKVFKCEYMCTYICMYMYILHKGVYINTDFCI